MSGGIGFTPSAAPPPPTPAPLPQRGRCINCGRNNMPLAPLTHSTTISYPGRKPETAEWVTPNVCPDCASTAIVNLAVQKQKVDEEIRKEVNRA